MACFTVDELGGLDVVTEPIPILTMEEILRPKRGIGGGSSRDGSTVPLKKVRRLPSQSELDSIDGDSLLGSEPSALETETVRRSNSRASARTVDSDLGPCCKAVARIREVHTLEGV
jgi:hypothetical protein